jgi:Ran GTPase-activating protein (RanGAP) involved in mRNA processing and transport
MGSLSESYVSYCIEVGMDLDPKMADFFNRSDVQLMDGHFDIEFNSRSSIIMNHDLLEHLLKIISGNLDRLKNLRLKYLALDDSSLSLIADHLEKMVSLETLDLTACEIKNDGVVKLAKLLPTTNLKCLILSGNKLAADGCKDLGNCIASTNLEILELADCGLSHDGFISIFNSIKQNNCKLLKLDISGCLLFRTEQNLAHHIEDCLKQNPKLRRLHIRKAGLRDTAVARIASGINYTENLTFLDLSANELSRDSATLLCPVLNKLEVLDLSNNRIQSEGAINLANQIMNNKIKLNTLGLKHAEIEDDGIQAILDAVGHSESNLHRIYLWGNQFEHGASIKLRDLMGSMKLKEHNTDCRANCSYHPDGAFRPAELARPNMQTPGII